MYFLSYKTRTGSFTLKRPETGVDYIEEQKAIETYTKHYVPLPIANKSPNLNSNSLLKSGEGFSGFML